MAVPLPVPVIVLLEFKFAFLLLARLRQANQGNEGMWFRNFVARLQIGAATLERKQLAAAVGTDGLDVEVGSVRQQAAFRAQAEAWRHVFLKNLDFQQAGAECDALRPLAMIVVMTMRVPVMMPAGQ